MEREGGVGKLSYPLLVPPRRWEHNIGTQYLCLVSRTCDQLAEIFQQADRPAVPSYAMNVFVLVDRLEQFDGVDVAVLGTDNGRIPVEELRRIVHCLVSRSASLLDCC